MAYLSVLKTVMSFFRRVGSTPSSSSNLRRVIPSWRWGLFAEQIDRSAVGVRNLYSPPNAGVVELVVTLDLGSSAERREGSTPSTRTSGGIIS